MLNKIDLTLFDNNQTQWNICSFSTQFKFIPLYQIVLLEHSYICYPDKSVIDMKVFNNPFARQDLKFATNHLYFCLTFNFQELYSGNFDKM